MARRHAQAVARHSREYLQNHLAAGLARDGTGEAGDRGPVESQGLPALLALAIEILPLGRPRTSTAQRSVISSAR
jgi:hypothetical protein